MSSFFPRQLNNYPENEYTLAPLFRLLDDFDTYRDASSSAPARRSNSHLATAKTFSPKFDLRELNDRYELHGELPGIESKDVDIEFTDSQTLHIHGHSERAYEAGTPPAALLGDGPQQSRIGGGDTESHRATVEDEETERAKEAGQVASAAREQQKQQQQTGEKFWVSERSVGDFSRNFNFPAKVDHDAVKASMKNGVLNVVVPKAPVHTGSRKIQIS